MMRKYRKRSVVIEAWLFNGSVDGMPSEIAGWCQDHDGSRSLFIQTLEGVMEAKPGDWIILGIKGEVYPCKPDVFEMTYEPA